MSSNFRNQKSLLTFLENLSMTLQTEIKIKNKVSNRSKFPIGDFIDRLDCVYIWIKPTNKKKYFKNRWNVLEYAVISEKLRLSMQILATSTTFMLQCIATPTWRQKPLIRQFLKTFWLFEFYVTSSLLICQKHYG